MLTRDQRRWGVAVALAAVAAVAACGEAPTDLARPNALCLAADGTLYVSDFHHQRVVAFDPQAGTTRAVFGRQGLGEGELWQVWDIACSDGQIWALNQRLVVPEAPTQLVEAKSFDDGAEVFAAVLRAPWVEIEWLGSFSRLPDGGWVATDEEHGALIFWDAQLGSPRRLTTPAGGEPLDGPSFVRRRGDELWVVEQSNSRVRRLSLEGRELGRFGREGRGEGELLYPTSVDVCPGRWVAVTDYGNYRVQRYTIDGEPLGGFEPAWSSPEAPAQLMRVVLSPDCERLYLADSKGQRVLVTTPTGEVVRELTVVSP